MLVTDAGMNIEVKAPQLKKAYRPMLSWEEGRLIVVREWQL